MLIIKHIGIILVHLMGEQSLKFEILTSDAKIS